MEWEQLESIILLEMRNFTNSLKELAPYNSQYRGLLNYQPVNFIHVDGKRVRTNTNTLRNSINFRYTKTGNNIVAQTYVAGNLPYYDKVVNSPTITYAIHYGRTEYGSLRYSNSKEITKANRNYQYYVRTGESLMRNLVGKYNGATLYSDKSIEEYR